MCCIVNAVVYNKIGYIIGNAQKIGIFAKIRMIF